MSQYFEHGNCDKCRNSTITILKASFILSVINARLVQKFRGRAIRSEKYNCY